MNVAEALAPLDPAFSRDLGDAYDRAGEMAREMLARGEMPPTRALMVGLALDPEGRVLLDDALERYADPLLRLPSEVDEVIVGGGAHAAIYAATRTRQGLPKPLVLEQDARFGGVFAMTRNSSFFLNSRNRPGPLGAPGSRDALNVIAGAPMQPSDLSMYEYQANADLGLVVRCTLAMNATIRQAKVQEIARQGSRLLVLTDRGVISAKRVIVATGLGQRQFFTTTPYTGGNVMTFEQFMRRFDTMMFPLRGLGRVAVIGGGDSGRTAVEALTGYGPNMGASVASLDYVERIDWYGVGVNMTKEQWLECNRTRYKPLAALFPNRNKTTDNARVRGLDRRQTGFLTADGIVVNGTVYDTMIGCTSFFQTWVEMAGVEGGLAAGVTELKANNDKGVILGLANEDRSLVVVGPAAKIPTQTSAETGPDTPENRVALFRLAPRTGAVATLLPPT